MSFFTLDARTGRLSGTGTYSRILHFRFSPEEVQTLVGPPYAYLFTVPAGGYHVSETHLYSPNNPTTIALTFFELDENMNWVNTLTFNNLPAGTPARSSYDNNFYLPEGMRVGMSPDSPPPIELEVSLIVYPLGRSEFTWSDHHRRLP